MSLRPRWKIIVAQNFSLRWDYWQWYSYLYLVCDPWEMRRHRKKQSYKQFFFVSINVSLVVLSFHSTFHSHANNIENAERIELKLRVHPGCGRPLVWVSTCRVSFQVEQSKPKEMLHPKGGVNENIGVELEAARHIRTAAVLCVPPRILTSKCQWRRKCSVLGPGWSCPSPN